MKRNWIIAIVLAALVVVGCGRESDFKKFAEFLEQTDPSKNGVTGFTISKSLNPLTSRSDASIPFLKEKAESSDPRTAATACVALDFIYANLANLKDPVAEGFLKQIEPSVLMDRIDEIQTNGLNANFLYWLDMARKDFYRGKPYQETSENEKESGRASNAADKLSESTNNSPQQTTAP
jgi:hypothetical protein